ncbi:MAG: hypothetical protein U0414_26045 [Polyangiaceae bacterium]
MSALSSRARGRTLRHMQALLSTAALTAACSSKDEKRIDRSWPDPPSGRGSSSASNFTSSSSGYAVVDPMPMPARCTTVGQANITAKATGKPRSDGKVDLTVELTAAQTEPLVIAGVTALSNVIGTAKFEAKPPGASVTAVVDPTKANADLTLRLTCGAETGPLTLSIETKAPYAVRILPY